MAIAALVLGVVSLVIAVGGGPAGLGWVGSICGILAIILGAVAKKTPERQGMATAGIVCGVISLLWGAIETLACVACLGAGAAALGSFL